MRLFRNSFETPKQTETRLSLVSKMNRNKRETDPVSVIFSSNRNFYLFVSWTPYSGFSFLDLHTLNVDPDTGQKVICSEIIHKTFNGIFSSTFNMDLQILNLQVQKISRFFTLDINSFLNKLNFSLLDPDPDGEMNGVPDPKHCFLS